MGFYHYKICIMQRYLYLYLSPLTYTRPEVKVKPVAFRTQTHNTALNVLAPMGAVVGVLTLVDVWNTPGKL